MNPQILLKTWIYPPQVNPDESAEFIISFDLAWLFPDLKVTSQKI